ARAGLKAGDVVLSMGGIEVEHPDALGYRLATRAIGSTADLVVLRQGKEVTLTLALERAPEGASAAEVLIDGRSPFAGAKIAALSPRLAQRLRVADNAKGVAIVAIDGNSPAAGFGFRPGDIVREVNGEEIATPDDLVRAAGAQTRWWRFSVERQGQLIRQMLRY